MTERILQVAADAKRAGHGGKTALYQAACQEMQISLGTLHRKLKQLIVQPVRKRRADAGKTALTSQEAMMLSAVLIESTRKNGKRLLAVEDAVEMLRSNGQIRAEYIDADTGEIQRLSTSAIVRALRGYGLYPDQLTAPAPACELASLHPNHVWQIDASLCVLYYLANGHSLQVMDHKKFYKNKPKNLSRIAAERVWSYEITDHTSGWIYVEYVLGAESGENLCSVLINAMQERNTGDVLHGVPQILYLDPGSANTAGMTRNLCRSLGIKLLVHKAGNARATGQVEKARDIIERKFEPGLKYQLINSLDELNELARQWRQYFNTTAIHRRHRQTRTAVWLTISHEQLIKAPTVAVCRELAVASPESRVVTTKLRIPFRGTEYDVSSVPGVMVGEKIMITRNPWRDSAAQVVLIDADGHEYYHLIEAVEKDELGFAATASVIGQNYRRPAHTRAQKAAAEIEQLITGTDNPTDATLSRKTKALPFGGRINPYQHIDDTELSAYLPKRGQASTVRAPRQEQRPLTHVEAARVLRNKLSAAGHDWLPSHFTVLQTGWPNGIDELEIDKVADALMHIPRLIAVNDQ